MHKHKCVGITFLKCSSGAVVAEMRSLKKEKERHSIDETSSSITESSSPLLDPVSKNAESSSETSASESFQIERF